MGRGDGLDGRRNPHLVRFTAAHLLATIAEWSLLIGVLVYAYERSGARAAGFASFVSLVPYVALSGWTAGLAVRHPPAAVRTVALTVGALGAVVCGACALADGPTAVVVAGAVAMFTAATSLKPISSVMLPAIVRTSRELVVANVWLGHCENASVLLGPLSATALLALGGPGAVMFGCAALCAVASVLSLGGTRVEPRPTSARGADTSARRGALAAVTRPFTSWFEVMRGATARGVLAVDAATYIVIGAFDIVLVVIAGEYLDLGDAGAGVLGSLFGVGAFASSAVTGRLATRPRLAPTLLALGSVIVVGSAVLGASVHLATVCVVLPAAGFARGVVGVLGHVLLQRSAPPSELPRLFGARSTSSGIGLLLGSVTAQAGIAASGVPAALGAVAAVLGVVLLASRRALRSADNGADVPVVAMTLLHRLTPFEPLPTPALESVARAARELHLPAGTEVVRQGDPGVEYFAVAAGSLDVSVGGATVRTIGRGDGFGEIALLADVARTATVSATTPVTLFVIERVPFLVAVTGHAAAGEAAWSAIDHLEFDGDAPSRQ